MKLHVLANLYIATLCLTIGFLNIILNGKILLDNPFWMLIILTLIGIGAFNLGIAIAKINEMGKNKKG